MQHKNLIILLSMAVLLSAFGMANADTTVYDRHYNRQGYEKESRGVVTRYDRNWNRTGYEKDGRIYDKNWNLQGYKKKNDTTVIYDKQWNRTGYEKDNKIYD
ncbi:MAG TPA: hypothetical protein PKY94_07360, partial [Smithellaceae bacterium]|nr:hypothetical protein [Smithellaceae bacterium]